MLDSLIDFGAGTRARLEMDAGDRLHLRRDRNGYAGKGSLESAVQDLGEASRTVRLTWRAHWTVPLKWEKIGGNPVFAPSQTASWNSWVNGVSIVPTTDGALYRMYFAGRTGEGIGFAEAPFSNPCCWTEHPSNPVLRPRDDNWEGNLINQPRVVAITAEHWRMYYTGWGFEGPGTKWALGAADSHDGGTTWQRVSEEPILDRGDIDSPDGGGACVPMVLRVGDRWMMWYTAGRVHPQEHQHIHLCLATSQNGLDWEKYPGNPVLTDDFDDNALRSVSSRCYVRYDEGIYRMWYSFAKPDYRICYAESLNGIHWERATINPVLEPSQAPAWDDTMVEYPEVQMVDGVFRLWFCGNGYGSVGYAEGRPQTGVSVEVRTGATAQPDETWTDWFGVGWERPFEAQRFLQVRAWLWSYDPRQSPVLSHMAVVGA